MNILRAALVGSLVIACNDTDFDPISKIEGVRILATATDTPYVAPGAAVTLRVLAVDERVDRPLPLGIWWIPAPCIDPKDDAYYACFDDFRFPVGVDLGPSLTAGDTFDFTMPPGAITDHVGSAGDIPYGVAVAFVIACAGHVEYLGPSPPSGAPDAVPFGCFDADRNQLGADDFVFGYDLVYAFEDHRNSDRVIDAITLDGAPVDPASGITLPTCTEASIDDCPSRSLSLTVPAASQERDPANPDTDGAALGEELWVDWYLTAGKVKHDTVLLYDPRKGALADTSDDLFAPQLGGSNTLWAVVHDNRGGVAWTSVPLVTR